MKKLLIIQLVWVLAAGSYALIAQSHLGVSFFVGALLMLGNGIFFEMMISLFKPKSEQKVIALKTPLVVLKYPIWGLAIYWIIQQNWLVPIAFVFGLLTWMISLTLYALLSQKEKGDS